MAKYEIGQKLSTIFKLAGNLWALFRDFQLFLDGDMQGSIRGVVPGGLFVGH